MPNQKYETQVRPHLAEVAMLARQGVSESVIAQKLKISSTSLRKYKRENAELAEALSSRERANMEVLNAFFKRACGYVAEEEVRELKEIKEDDGSIRKELITTKVVRKDVPPDLSAVKWWMENKGMLFPLQEQKGRQSGDLEQARALLQEKERILGLLAERAAQDEQQAAAETVGD